MTRTNVGEEIEEIGIGCGGGDLIEHQELEVDNAIIDQLLSLFPKMEESIMMDIKQVFDLDMRLAGVCVVCLFCFCSITEGN